MGRAIYHLNCGTLKPFFPRIEAVIYCLLVETNRGLALIDTGPGRGDYLEPSLKMKIFKWMVGMVEDPGQCARDQIRDLGFAPADVKDIILTHLHLDHAGGLPDFPDARVHIFREEFASRHHPRGLEYAYEPRHWAHNPRWVVHDEPDLDWIGFQSLRINQDLEPDIRLIPLPGHTRGHCGVAVDGDEGWLLHCGDAASPYHPDSDIHGRARANEMGKWVPGWFVDRVLGRNIQRLKDLVRDHGDEVKVISSHDRYSFLEHQI